MLTVSRVFCVRSVFLCLLAVVAAPALQAQLTQNPTLNHQLSRLDLGIMASGVFNSQSNGTAVVNGKPTAINLRPSNSVGPLFTVRYTIKPLIGFEFNYSYARYNENFTPFGYSPAGPQTGGVQQNTSEYTLGYVAHFRTRYGLTPFAGAGLGTLEFTPTAQGGQGLLPQARATYYYEAGADAMFNPHFGLRAQFRQQFFLAPDFETNYLTILKRTTSIEPAIGVVLHF